MAHRFLTHLESEQGRADAAIARLLEYAKMNRNDAQLFAGLVHACRYAGLLNESLAAHAEARRLDPNVGTSVEYTLMMLSRFDELEKMTDDPSADRGAVYYGLALSGRQVDVNNVLSVGSMAAMPQAYRLTLEAFIAVATGTQEEASAAVDRAAAYHSDPEALFLIGMMTARRLADMPRAFRLLESAARGGFTPLPTLETSPLLAPLRDKPEFQLLMELARQRATVAETVFSRGGGKELLGIA
jgi:hypothetical protein